MRLRHSLARLGACALLGLAGFAGSVHAAGTRADTSIENAAKLYYKVGGVDQDEVCSSPNGNSTKTCDPTKFKVDNKVNLKVTTVETSPVESVPGGTSALTFRVTNDGNSPQGYSFTVISDLTGSVTSMFGGATSVNDVFDPTGCTVRDGTDAQITSVASVEPDAYVEVKVVCTIPAGRAHLDIGAIALRATATHAGGGTLTQSDTNAPNVVDIVFADVEGPNDGPRDAAHSARSAYMVTTAAIQVRKSFTTICDPLGGAATTTPEYVPKSIPGAYVQYTVTIRNIGTAPVRPAILTNLVDKLDTANVTFDSKLITGANSGSNPACAPTGTVMSTGNAFKVTWAGGARTSFPAGVKYLTESGYYTAPNINVSWASVLPIEDGYTEAAQLKPGDVLTLTYNVFIN